MSYDPYYIDDYYDPTEEESTYSGDGTYSGMFFTPEQIAMQQMLMGQGGDPFAAYPPGMMGMAGLPQLDTKGREQPYDLGVAQQRLNFGQDVSSSGTNPFIQYMGGPGAYAPGALNPTMEETPLQLMQGPQMQMLRNSGGVMGTLADLILGDPQRGISGMNPNQAAARLRAMIERPEEHDLTPEEATALQGELAPVTDQMGKTTGPDWQSLYRMANDIYTPYSQEQAMLQQPDVQTLPDGRVVRVAQKDSPAMEFIKKMGLPDPRAQYDLEFALQSDPALGSLLQYSANSQAERYMMRKEFDERLKRIKKRRQDEEGRVAEDSKRMEQYAGATKQALADYFGASSRGETQRPSGPNRSGMAGAINNAGNPPGTDMRSVLGQVPGYGNAGVLNPESGMGGAANPPMLNPNSGMGMAAQGRRGQELNLPDKPRLTGGEQQYSMMETLLGKPIRDQRQRLLDEAVPLPMQRMINLKRNRKMQGEGTEAAWEYAMKLAPIINAGRRGRSPSNDVVQQRLAPLYAMGALGG